MKSALGFEGHYLVKLFRKGRLVATRRITNGIVNVGLDYVLNTSFRAGAAITTWYIAPIDNAAFSQLVATDTMAAHAGWAEWTDYDEAVRQTWTIVAPVSQQLTNTASKVSLAINANGTIKGMFLVSDNTKGGAGGTLFSTGLFDDGDLVVQNGDQTEITYILSAQDGS